MPSSGKSSFVALTTAGRGSGPLAAADDDVVAVEGDVDASELDLDAAEVGDQAPEALGERTPRVWMPTSATRARSLFPSTIS
jgi:hypothetical protein